MGYGIAKRKVTRALQKVFPQWLLEVSLLLQSENVQVAIMESYEEAPLLLKPGTAPTDTGSAAATDRHGALSGIFADLCPAGSTVLHEDALFFVGGHRGQCVQPDQ